MCCREIEFLVCEVARYCFMAKSRSFK